MTPLPLNPGIPMLIDEIASIETPAMAWLREASERAREANRQAEKESAR